MATLVPAILIASVCSSDLCNQVQLHLPLVPSVDLEVSIPIPESTDVVSLLARRTVHGELTQPTFQGCIQARDATECSRGRVTPLMEEDAVLQWMDKAGAPITLTVRASTTSP